MLLNKLLKSATLPTLPMLQPHQLTITSTDRDGNTLVFTYTFNTTYSDINTVPTQLTRMIPYRYHNCWLRRLRSWNHWWFDYCWWFRQAVYIATVDQWLPLLIMWDNRVNTDESYITANSNGTTTTVSTDVMLGCDIILISNIFLTGMYLLTWSV
jgi:hypothetical protein